MQAEAAMVSQMGRTTVPVDLKGSGAAGEVADHVPSGGVCELLLTQGHQRPSCLLPESPLSSTLCCKDQVVLSSWSAMPLTL